MWPNRQKPADFVTFTEDIVNGKLYFLYSEVKGKVEAVTFGILQESSMKMLKDMWPNLLGKTTIEAVRC